MQSISEWPDLVYKFFEVEVHVEDATSWLNRQCIVATLVTYLQFLQMIFYFNAHPKMATLTSTVNKAMSNTLHFLLMFAILFLKLAFMAHWLLGGKIPVFRTFGGAISAQGRMLFGEFIYAGGADRLNAAGTAMYWLYAFTF